MSLFTRWYLHRLLAWVCSMDWHAETDEQLTRRERAVGEFWLSAQCRAAWDQMIRELREGGES